jgi:hypothetical protein
MLNAVLLAINSRIKYVANTPKLKTIILVVDNSRSAFSTAMQSNIVLYSMNK